MTVAEVAPASWTMTDGARGQLEACGIALSELYRLLRKPESTKKVSQGDRRFSGYGIAAIVDACNCVTGVFIDGATADNWREWAKERALFGESSVEEADALLERDLIHAQFSRVAKVNNTAYRGPRRRRMTQEAPAPDDLEVRHILDSIHPALRAEITRQVDGDFSRLVVHSPTQVEIMPVRD